MNPSESILEKARFNSHTKVLRIDYSQNPDTSLQQVILLSGIRRSGYGILVNADGTYSAERINQIKERFRKLDINAIHEFPFTSGHDLDPKTKIAIEAAKFTWVFSTDKNWSEKPGFSGLNRSIEISIASGGILVKE